MDLGYAPHEQPVNFFLSSTKPSEEFSVRKRMNKTPEIVAGSIGNRPVKFGESLYIENIPTYNAKHPHGTSNGFNLICCDDTPGKQRFVGFGFEGTEEELY